MMSQASEIISFLLPTTMAAVAFAVGFYLARQRTKAMKAASHQPQTLEEEADDPTAQITPMIEIGRTVIVPSLQRAYVRLWGRRRGAAWRTGRRVAKGAKEKGQKGRALREMIG